MESNNDKEWRMEELVESKSFAELNEEEINFVLQELGSEQEYNSLRKISAALVADKADLSPDPRILANLKGSLHKRPAPAWYREVFYYKVPAYAVVILLAVAAMTFVLRDQAQNGKLPATISRIETDTVYISSPADTVFVDRVVVKYLRPAPSEAPDYSFVKNVPEELESTEGVNMKEKEELEGFLVSGS